MLERNPVNLRATIYKQIPAADNKYSSVTLNISAGLPHLLGDHHIGVGDQNGKTSISFQKEPPCLVVQNSELGKREIPIYDSTGETTTVSHASPDIKITLVFPTSEITNQLNQNG